MSNDGLIMITTYWRRIGRQIHIITVHAIRCVYLLLFLQANHLGCRIRHLFHHHFVVKRLSSFPVDRDVPVVNLHIVFSNSALTINSRRQWYSSRTDTRGQFVHFTGKYRKRKTCISCLFTILKHEQPLKSF